MPMSGRLLSAGFPLTVHNRSRGKVEEMVGIGARPADSPSEVSGAADVVLTCLPDVAAVEEVFLGPGGLVECSRAGQVLVDHSTVSPAISNKVYEAAASRGACFLDAPISGGVERAGDGTLTLMVGGDTQAFQRALPVFEACGSTIRYVGPAGSGSAVKLINQLLVGVHSVAAAEALLLGIRSGVDPELLLEILDTSWGQSFMLSRNGPVMVARDFADARAPLRLIAKDLDLVEGFAEHSAAPTPMGARALEVVREALAMGHAELDASCVIIPLEEREKRRY